MKNDRGLQCVSWVKIKGWCVSMKHGGHVHYLTSVRHHAVQMNGLSDTVAVVESDIFFLIGNEGLESPGTPPLLGKPLEN